MVKGGKTQGGHKSRSERKRRHASRSRGRNEERKEAPNLNCIRAQKRGKEPLGGETKVGEQRSPAKKIDLAGDLGKRKKEKQKKYKWLRGKKKRGATKGNIFGTVIQERKEEEGEKNYRIVKREPRSIGRLRRGRGERRKKRGGLERKKKNISTTGNFAWGGAEEGGSQ